MPTRRARPRRQKLQNVHTMAAKRNTNAASQHRRRDPPRKCAGCGKSGPGVVYQLDHIENLAAGGLDAPSKPLDTVPFGREVDRGDFSQRVGAMGDSQCLSAGSLQPVPPVTRAETCDPSRSVVPELSENWTS